MSRLTPSLCRPKNNEFEAYNNNRTNSFIRDGVLFLKPTLTAERLGEEALYSGTLDMRGGAPYDQSVSTQCKSTGFYGVHKSYGNRKRNTNYPNRYSRSGASQTA